MTLENGDSSTEGNSEAKELIIQKHLIEDLSKRVEKLEDRDIEKNFNSLIKSLKFISWLLPLIALVMLVGYLFFCDKGGWNKLIVIATGIIVIVQVIGWFINKK